MKMQFSDGTEDASFCVDCPYCGCGVYPKIVESAEEAEDKRHFIVRCGGSSCRKYFFVTKQKNSFQRSYDNDEYVYTINPKHLSQGHRFPDAIPCDIRMDYSEAWNCHQIEAYRASATMCRRVIQNCMRDKGAKKTKLIDQIDEVVTDVQLREVAHSIRVIGNWGAHEQDDEIKDVNWKKSKALLDFAWNIMDYLYITPKKLDEIKLSMAEEKDE